MALKNNALVSMVAEAVDGAKHLPISFSETEEEFIEELRDLGVESDLVECECGKKIPLSEVAAYSKDSSGIKFYCKECY